MKKIEIIKIGPKSAFKATLYFAIIPLSIMVALGFLVAIIGLAIGKPGLLAAGIPYIIMPVILIFVYGLIGMLSAFIYSKLATKFGGLEVTVVEKDKLIG